MRTILIHSILSTDNKMFDPNERDGYNDPYIYLREKLQTLGYCLKTADNNTLSDCDFIFFYDANSVFPYSKFKGYAKKIKSILLGKPFVRDVYKECVEMGMEKKMVLFLWEPPSVLPENWDPALHNLFTNIFTWHDGYVDGKKIFKMCWPQTRQFPPFESISFSKKKILVNISMNKSSNHPNELYSARRESIRYFERTIPNEFDLFGVGWDQPRNLTEKLFPFIRYRYPSYRGCIKNKWEVLPRYRFSLCYENISSEPGWITEKIFDSMRCGCIPIYWGAPNVSDYVDANAFIDRRMFKTNSELKDYLLNMSERDYDNFQQSIRDYLQSERFSRFLPPAFAETIIRNLHL